MSERHRTFDVLGILTRFHAFPDEVGGKFCLAEAVVPPGLGAPPNSHAGETEAFFVIDGEVEVEIEGTRRRHGPGSFVTIPDGAVHAFAATGDRPARVLILNAPGAMHAQFFTAIGRALPEGTQDLPPPAAPDLARVLAAAEAAGMVLAAPASV